jgi:uncharacterized protein (TIGR02145 family)
MKKQSKKSPLWIFRGLLLAALGGLGTAAFAQGVEICTTDSYAIPSTVDASGASEYQWLENGQLLSKDASGSSYLVPSGKVAGQYTYIRQAKSADCPDWQSSNEFVVTVFACSFTAGAAESATAVFTDPRDGKSYKTVTLNGKTWFAQNLNYTIDLTYNAYSYEANGKQFTSTANGAPAIGSYWCPPLYRSNGVNLVPVASGNQGTCDTYGALYTWETAMMVDGKYADEAKTNTAWDELYLVSSSTFDSGAPGTTTKADRNNARGEVTAKEGGRGICPKSWHVPTDLEWAQMLDKVEGGDNFVKQAATGWLGANNANGAGAKLKSAATSASTFTDPGDGSWIPYNDGTRGTNTSGFGAVPAGHRAYTGSQFYDRGLYAIYWSSSVGSSSLAWYRSFYYSYAQVERNLNSRSYGFAVRCVRDN